MSLGKRPRGPIMRRTTSMSGITVDVPNMDASSASEPSDHNNNNNNNMIIRDVHATTTVGLEEGSLVHQNNYDDNNMMMDTSFGAGNSSGLLYHDQRLLATMVSPRNYRNSNINNSSGDFVEPAHFLRSCGLCKRRLASGKDIYMYRGDTAFCSLECREQQMKKDAKKDKCSVMIAGKKEDRHTSSSTTSSKSSSRKSETLAAA